MSSIDDELFQSQLKASFKGKIFIGCWTEKRFCELKSYRDIIVIDKSEKELSKELKCFLRDVSNYYKIFVGVSVTDDDCSILTELDNDSGDSNSTFGFGKYWFHIKTIKFRHNEVQIKLKILRAINDNDSNTFASKINDKAPQQALFDSLKAEAEAIIAWISSINRQNIFDTLKFIALLFVSIAAGSTQIIKYIGIFAIKLIERITWLAHVLTPTALGIIDLCSKIIGGFYLLLAMMWKDSVGRRNIPPNSIEDIPRQRPQAIHYRRQ